MTGCVTKKSRKKHGLKRKYSIYAWIFIAPCLLCFGVFQIYPLVDTILLTFQKVQGTNSQFVGLDNYARLLKDNTFWTAMKNMVFYYVTFIPIQAVLSLVLSAILNQKFMKLKGVYRTLIFLPCVISLVAYALVFKNLFSGSGIVNNLLVWLGAISKPVQWLNEFVWAKVLMIVALCWRWTGYDMMFYLSGMQGISPELYEVASLDGAGPVRKFFSITLPLLKPIILFCMISNTIGTLQLFEEPMNLTGGGPGTATISLAQYLYQHSFVYTPNYGYSAAMSIVMLIIVAILSFIQFKVGGRGYEE